MIRPLQKAHELDALLKYTSARRVLKEEVERLDKDVAWRGLMAITAVAEQARTNWRLEKLLDYRFAEVSLASGTWEPPGRKRSPKSPGPGRNLSFAVERKIEPLHRMIEALTDLGRGEQLILARRYSPQAGRALDDWVSFRDERLRESGKRDQPPGAVVFWIPPEQGFVVSFERQELTKRLTLPQVIDRANYEPPTPAELELLRKEQTSITLPNLGVPIGLLESTTLVELGTLLAFFYFWLYYREARGSPSFPAEGTLFGVFARSSFTRWVFSILLGVPAVATAILGSKSQWVAPENVIIAVLVVAVAVLVRTYGALPAAVHDDVGEAADGNGPAVG